MKKILSIALSSLCLLTSCDLDINEDPNNASGSVVTPDLIFPAAENFVADCVGDQLFNYAGFFAQYFEQMPTANQYNDEAEYNIDESKDMFGRPYIYLYSGALMDLKEIESRTSNTADLFACAVLRAYTFQVVVDNLGNAPYKEALMGAANAMPAWDNGQDVYEGVLAELDKAEAALNSSDKMSLTDPMLNKDINEWIGFANALRLRMLFRLVDGNINVAENTAKIKSLVAKNNFISEDVTWDVYQNLKGQYNPWYGSFDKLGAKNHCAAYPIVAYMSATSDPRIAYAINPRKEDNTYVGQFPGAKTKAPAWLGIATNQYQEAKVSGIDYSQFADAPVYLYTQAEVEFLKAEAELRFNNDDAAAKSAYESAVAIDFASRGVAGADAFLAASNTSWTGSVDDKLKLVYMQKWVALFMRDHMEAWTEARRTDIPAVSAASGEEICKDPTKYTAGDFILPAVNLKGDGKMAMSMPYPKDARALNKNTPKARRISDKVFWDIK